MNLFVKLGIVAATGTAVYLGLSKNNKSSSNTNSKGFAVEVEKVQNIFSKVTSLITSFVVISNNVSNLLDDSSPVRNDRIIYKNNISNPTIIL